MGGSNDIRCFSLAVLNKGRHRAIIVGSSGKRFALKPPQWLRRESDRWLAKGYTLQELTPYCVVNGKVII